MSVWITLSMKYKCEVKRKLEFKEKINGIMDYVEAESKFRTKHRYDPASAILVTCTCRRLQGCNWRLLAIVVECLYGGVWGVAMLYQEYWQQVYSSRGEAISSMPTHCDAHLAWWHHFIETPSWNEIRWIGHLGGRAVKVAMDMKWKSISWKMCKTHP